MADETPEQHVVAANPLDEPGAVEQPARESAVATPAAVTREPWVLSEQQVRDRASTWLERIVQVLLGVALVQSFTVYSSAIVAPRQYWTLTLGLVVVFYIALSSWIALSRLVSEFPYDPALRIGKVRFYADVGAVIVYAYLLISLKPLYVVGNAPEAVLTGHLVGYPLVLLAYSLASFARRRQLADENRDTDPHIKRRPQPLVALVTCGVVTAVVVVYGLLVNVHWFVLHRQWVNRTTLVIVLVVWFSYRRLWDVFARRKGAAVTDSAA